MKKLRKSYKGFVPSEELPFVIGDQVPVKAGTTIYVCDCDGAVVGSFPLSTAWTVTIELIFNGKAEHGESRPSDEMDPRFGWWDEETQLQVRFQELLEQGAIPPRQNYQ